MLVQIAERSILTSNISMDVCFYLLGVMSGRVGDDVLIVAGVQFT